ncbi:MAG TPA: DUF3820 family protein [Gemmataceae bacterium]|nr:DUF3820 family protein [Gemmataceae bacterium]
MLFPAIPFGKYKGVPLADVPGDYLAWLSRRRRVGSELRETVEEELSRRRWYAARCLGPAWWYARRRTAPRESNERTVKR